MQIPDLIKIYEAKTDEEPIHLVRDSKQLTLDAHAVLRGELARRRIDLTDLSTVTEESEQVGVAQPNLGKVLSHDSPVVAKFVSEVLRIYHGQFWLFFKLTAPAVVLGYLGVFWGRHEGASQTSANLLGHSCTCQCCSSPSVWLLSELRYSCSGGSLGCLMRIDFA